MLRAVPNPPDQLDDARHRWDYRVTCVHARVFDTKMLNDHVKQWGDAGWELTAATVVSFKEGPAHSFIVQLMHTLYWRKPQGAGRPS
jgi:hypothetical protein